MSRALAAHRAAVCAGVALLLAAPSQALEFFDGRLNVTGFYEAQIRGLANDYSGVDGYDLAAWDNVLNIETEAEIAPYGWGPFNLVTGFARIEVRYNCVYNHACGMFQSVDAYGDDAQRIPKRLLNGRRSGTTGTLFTNDAGSREYRRIRLRGRDAKQAAIDAVDTDGDGIQDAAVTSLSQLSGIADAGLLNDTLGASSRRPLRFEEIPPFTAFAGIAGPDAVNNDNASAAFQNAANIVAANFGVQLTSDDPFPAVADKFRNCRFGVEDTKGPNLGKGRDVLPHSFNCPIDSTAMLGDVPNPFRAGDINPRLSLAGPDGVLGTADDGSAVGGSAELPLRPAPIRAAGTGAIEEAQGIWYPNRALRGRLADFDTFDQNFREEELQWNRGAAQQDEKELKELYLDIEMFDSRLWLRLGKQNIVWGKTELFRTTDQFNPQDLALASLPSLEESRIGLWAARGVWSFYEVGPFQDVRLELAANFDQFEPTDLGRCGEPFVPRAACDLTFGLMAHGIAQNGLAGTERPEDPWNSSRGLEVGGRIEWRWDRFSFALVDFYGYSDTPFLDRVFTFSRNVDPVSGAPRIAGASGECRDDDGDGQPEGAACLFDSTLTAGQQRERSLLNHPANQQSFAFICSTSIGFTSLDTTVCAQSVFNSQNLADPATPLTVSTALSVVLSGRDAQQNTLLSPLTGTTTAIFPLLAQGLAEANAATLGAFAAQVGAGRLTAPPLPGLPSPLVPLVAVPDDLDANDAAPRGVPIADILLVTNANTQPTTLSSALTDAQEALIGCGDYFGTHCDYDGLDLLNASASAVMQSFPGIEGSATAARAVGVDPFDFTTTNPAIAQPGTVGFPGVGAICGVAGQATALAGCRGPGPDGVAGTADDDPGYDPLIDGQVQSGATPGQTDVNGINGRRLHPFTGQPFRSEMAIFSWNTLMSLAAFSAAAPWNDLDDSGTIEPAEMTPGNRNPKADRDLDGVLDSDTFDLRDPSTVPGQTAATVGPFRTNGCSLAKPNLCSSVQALFTVSGVQRRVVQAGGTGRFGRRDFSWHGGGDAVLKYEKRNVLGFSMDFAEDWSKSNWSVEATWIEDLPRTNNDSFDGLEEVDQYNLTISVDRPTFVSFLNANRTFFINSQWFFRYESNYDDGFTSNGPFNAFFTLNVQTGYFQDRLLPSVTTVFDFGSSSGAVLPQITYRFTEKFSATFGLNVFFGELERKDSAVNPLSLPNRAGEGLDDTYVENGLSAVREKDEIFARIRYTF